MKKLFFIIIFLSLSFTKEKYIYNPNFKSFESIHNKIKAPHPDQEKIDYYNSLKPDYVQVPIGINENRLNPLFNNSGSRATVEVYFCTDSWGSESSWNIFDSEGNGYYDGNYGAGWIGNNTCHSEFLELGTDDYTISLFDSYGDGGLTATVIDPGIGFYVETFGGGLFSHEDTRNFDSHVECGSINDYYLECGGGSWGSEIYWTLSEGSFGGVGVSIFCLSDGDYTLLMEDAWGDGWNGNTWTLTDSNGNFVASCGLDSGSEGTCDFTLDSATLVAGCTDETAENYNFEATIDDGTCTWNGGCSSTSYTACASGDQCVPLSYWCDGSSEWGNAGWGPDCTDGSDENFDNCCASGDYADSLCNPPANCEDETACNFGSEGSCEYAATGLNCDGSIADGFFLDCSGGIVPESYLSWQGDGYCDDGAWGVDLNCCEFNLDNGDCGSVIGCDDVALECGGALIDNCNICDNNFENDCIQDCNGVWDGDATLDECGVCDNIESNNCELNCNELSILDNDLDGVCDFLDLDDDNDGVNDSEDVEPLNNLICSDIDFDECDDCSNGTYNVLNDGLDSDNDGLCDLGDNDDDNDGCVDDMDDNPLILSVDTDSDGSPDDCDMDDDNDGVQDEYDSSPLDYLICLDDDMDSCEDCSSGFYNIANDGDDYDQDGLCDIGDPDDDNDGILDADDSDNLNPNICSDIDEDGCDDCSSGNFDVGNDGEDFDWDGICDIGDEDDDGDGIIDIDDNCLFDWLNDEDEDGICGFLDNCLEIYNPDQSDLDGDGLGDLCDTDPNCATNNVDECGICGGPGLTTYYLDFDGDGLGEINNFLNDCEPPEGYVFDNTDICPFDFYNDFDGDGLCGDMDDDDDNDGIVDDEDNDPLNPNICLDNDNDGCDDCSSGSYNTDNDGEDFDQDGLCDIGDADDDNDGSLDVYDIDDLNTNICSDEDEDGCDDCSSGNFDVGNDGEDLDSDGLCDLGDEDDDNDGIIDDVDTCPIDFNNDSDFDGICDSDEIFGCTDDSACNYDDRFTTDSDNSLCIYSIDLDHCATCSGDTDGTGFIIDNDTDDDYICNLDDNCPINFNPEQIDEDGDTVGNECDWLPLNNLYCSDLDGDICDDCRSGTFDLLLDGPDYDSDGLCDFGDLDSDNDSIDNYLDNNPLNEFICRDDDEDECDDCYSGMFDINNDGPDYDGDGFCDVGDFDDDNDLIDDSYDSHPLNEFLCMDYDNDLCDDCTSGEFDLDDDGDDFDLDGLCDNGDMDDDNDGILDSEDSNPLNPFLCLDEDNDSCDDCSNGSFDLNNDGNDTDEDGLCDLGDDDPLCFTNDTDICGTCAGNGYDQCDDDQNGVPNIEDWGYGAHSISVSDIPNDQGGRVHITFNKSFFDTDSLRNNESYMVERNDGDYWTSLLTINAYDQEVYHTEVNTIMDSTSSTSGVSEFRVIAFMEEGNFLCMQDENGFGYSVDNIVPPPPSSISGEFVNNQMVLNWSSSTAEDLSHYQILRNNENLVNITSTQFIDEIENFGIEYVYSVLAVDIHDNVSFPIQTTVLSGMLGDNNQDNQITISDIIIIVEMIMDIQEPNLYQTSVSDYNQDGIINVNDIVAIIYLILEL